MSKISHNAAFLLLAVILAGWLLMANSRSASAQDISPAVTQGQDSLSVNEVMADNKDTLADPDEPAETPDWFEIYNPGPTTVSLNGLGLADGQPLDAGFPITDGLSIPAGGFAVFYADSDPKQGPYHTNFKLNNVDGESVILYRLAGKSIISRIDFPPLATDQSYGRKPDGTGAPRFLPVPSPGGSNASDPPQINDVTKPVYPPAAPVNIKVTVDATVTDTQSTGTLTVTLHYSATGIGIVVKPMALVGINRYAADIDPLPSGTLVTYYVQAVDQDNEESRWPLLGREYRYLTGYDAPKLVINEIVVWNNSYFVDPDEPAETPDWIELYNPGTTAVSLNGLSVTDDKDNPLRFMLPPGISLAPGGIVTLLADDDIGQNLAHPGKPPVHLNFNLNKADAYVGLFGGQGTVKIDSHSVKATPLLGAVGRLPNGGDWATGAVCPTYGARNLLCDKAMFVPYAAKK